MDTTTELPFREHLNTIREVEQRLRVSHTTVYRYINTGVIRTVKVGHRRMVTESDLIEFIEDCRQPVPGAIAS